MSTGVDITGKPVGRKRSSSAETRTRVLQAARIAFSYKGFDHAGIRDIAESAATDAAIVIRLFGSKESLFAEVADGAFGLESVFAGSLNTFGDRVACYLMQPRPGTSVNPEFEPFQFLLRAATSPVASRIVSASLEKSFVLPLSKLIGGRNAPVRAALITAYVLGLTTMRFALTSTSIESGSPKLLIRMLGEAIQACIDTPDR